MRVAPALALTTALIATGPLAASVSAATALIATGPLAASVSAATPPLATARLASCHTSLVADQRSATFVGVMRELPGHDARLLMRFELLQRLAGDHVFAPLAAPGLGVWLRAPAGYARFRFRQRVTGLAAPAAYRALVVFRWVAADGRQLARAAHVSGICRQPDLRPELRISELVPLPTAGPGASFRVVVANTGRSPAAQFDVELSIGGTALPEQAVAGLSSHTHQALVFTATACPAGASVVAIADPESRIDQRSRVHDSLAISCPVATTSAVGRRRRA